MFIQISSFRLTFPFEDLSCRWQQAGKCHYSHQQKYLFNPFLTRVLLAVLSDKINIDPSIAWVYSHLSSSTSMFQQALLASDGKANSSSFTLVCLTFCIQLCLPRNTLSREFAGREYQGIIPGYDSWQNVVQHFSLREGLELPWETEQFLIQMVC